VDGRNSLAGVSLLGYNGEIGIIMGGGSRMGKVKIEGSFVAIITPFNHDGSVDFEGFRTLMDFQAENGTSALLIMGSTGEVSMLSVEEKRTIISETVKFKKGDVLLYYGCTRTNTQETIEMVRYAGREGADGAIITAPPYICPPVEDALRYFLEVARIIPTSSWTRRPWPDRVRSQKLPPPRRIFPLCAATHLIWG
jgi:hypothetical protein